MKKMFCRCLLPGIFLCVSVQTQHGVFFSPSHLLYLPFFPPSLPLVISRNSDPGSHHRLSFPLPTTTRAFELSREDLIQVISSLADSRRISPLSS